MERVDQLLGTAGVAARLNISPSAVKQWELAGRIPPAFARVSPGDRRVWRCADIEAITDTANAQKRDRSGVEKEAATAA